MNTTDPYAALREPLTGSPFPDGHPDAPPQREPVPPGMAWTLGSDGEARLAYLPPGYEKTRDAPPPAPTERDKWPLRMATGGAATATVLGVVGHYGQGIDQAGHGVGMALLGVAAATAGVGFAVSLLKGGAKRSPVSVTVNTTVAPSFSANSRSSNRGR